MREACPITKDIINEKVARLNAFIVLITILVFVITPAKWIVFILGADFLIRGFGLGKYSPLSIFNKFVLKLLRTKPSMVNAGPKVFAAKIGLIFCVLMSVFYLLNQGLAANVTACMMGFCASLEAFLGLCVACKMYPLVHRMPVVSQTQTRTETQIGQPT